MPRRAEEPVVRVHVHLFERDLARLSALFDSNIGKAAGIRRIVRQFLDRLDAKVSETAQAIPDEDLP